jgi:hypothetical protein
MSQQIEEILIVVGGGLVGAAILLAISYADSKGWL